MVRLFILTLATLVGLANALPVNEDNPELIQPRDSCQPVTVYTTTVTATSISTVIVTSSTQPVVTATPQCTALTIKKFSIGDTGQTIVAQANLYFGNDIVIDTDSLFGPFTNPFPSTDTWYGQTPSLSLLYTCDSERYVFISYEGAGSYILVPGSLSLNPGALSVSATAPISGSSINIYAVVWGASLITNQVVLNSLYNCQGSRNRSPVVILLCMLMLGLDMRRPVLFIILIRVGVCRFFMADRVHMVLSPGHECCWIGLGPTPQAQYIACLSHTSHVLSHISEFLFLVTWQAGDNHANIEAYTSWHAASSVDLPLTQPPSPKTISATLNAPRALASHCRLS
jgi:uncharacterized membrane protein